MSALPAAAAAAAGTALRSATLPSAQLTFGTGHNSPLLLAAPRRRAHLLSCRHVGEELLWEGLVPFPAVREFTYRLVVVNEAFEALKWASERHTIVLPEELEDGAIGGQWGGGQNGVNSSGILAAAA